MPQKPHSKEQLTKWWEAYKEANYNVEELARRMKGPRPTWQHRINSAMNVLGVSVPADNTKYRKTPATVLSDAVLRGVWATFAAEEYNETRTAQTLGISRQTLQARVRMCVNRLGLEVPQKTAFDKKGVMMKLLRRPGGISLTELAEITKKTRGQILDDLEMLAGKFFNLHKEGELYSIHASPSTGVTAGRNVTHNSNLEGWYRFGVVADSHICSRYARTEVLHDIYDAFVAAGVTQVYHCGNMIDGFRQGINDHDVVVAGMDDQINMLVKEYPQRKGITTYAVSGDDHEGWFAQKLGIDIGKRIQQSFREAGRTDWVDLGFMECFVSLKHAVTGAEAQLLVCHPGGGSSYADSYVVQKIVESYEGGEKPGVALFGHYHKMLTGEYRNVWYCLVPCTQDQTPWARKKRLRYVIGGLIVEAWQRPETGAIERFRVEQLRYFNKGYYNDRWNHTSNVVLPERTRS